MGENVIAFAYYEIVVPWWVAILMAIGAAAVVVAVIWATRWSRR